MLTSYDVHPVPEAPLAALSRSLFSVYRAEVLPPEVIEANHRSTEEALAALRFFDLGRGVATVAGVLMFGRDPRYHVPGAYVQFLRFPGTQMTDLPTDQAEVSCDLQAVLGALFPKIRAYNTTAMINGAAFRDELAPAYPEWALREILLNAVVHRDYASTAPIRFYWFADRIEIANPGGLHGHVTIATLKRRNSYRNPVLAEALKQLRYVNRFGFGLQRAEQLLQENGNPPLEFDIDDQAFGVTIRRREAPRDR